MAFQLDDARYERQLGVSGAPGHLPTANRWEDDCGSLESRVPVTLGDLGDQRHSLAVEPAAFDFQFSDDPLTSLPWELHRQGPVAADESRAPRLKPDGPLRPDRRP